MEVEKIELSKVILDPANARKHSPKNLAAITGSLTRFGQQKPIVIDKKGVVIAGNGTVMAARELGWKHIHAYRTALEGYEAMAFALSDNRTAELAEWEDDVLRESLAKLALNDIDVGFLDFQLPDVVSKPGLTDDDAVPEDLPENIHGVKRGDIWELGGHRLLCGDATAAGDVAKLMGDAKADLWLTDPPYGVSYKSNGSEDKHRDIENDSMPIEEMKVFWQKVCENAISATSNESPYYWFACQGGDQMMMMMAISAAGWKVRHELIWAKDSLVMGRCDYHYQHEPIFYGWKLKGKHNWYSDRKQTSLLSFPRPKKSDLHPTMKPVELIAYLIGNSSKVNDKVLETFCGSGSTLIACEKTSRKCYGMEIDPHYCSVIIERWQQFTGKKAKKLGW